RTENGIKCLVMKWNVAAVIVCNRKHTLLPIVAQLHINGFHFIAAAVQNFRLPSRAGADFKYSTSRRGQPHFCPEFVVAYGFQAAQSPFGSEQCCDQTKTLQSFLGEQSGLLGMNTRNLRQDLQKAIRNVFCIETRSKIRDVNTVVEYWLIEVAG